MHVDGLIYESLRIAADDNAVVCWTVVEKLTQIQSEFYLVQ